LIANDTLTTVDAADLKSGDYHMRNTTIIDSGEVDENGTAIWVDDPLNDKVFEVVINGKDSARNNLKVN